MALPHDGMWSPTHLPAWQVLRVGKQGALASRYPIYKQASRVLMIIVHNLKVVKYYKLIAMNL